MKSTWIAALFLIAFGFALGSQAAHADSWALPGTETTESESGNFRFTVEPTPIASQLDYFREEVIADRNGEEVERPKPLGLLEQRDASGEWSPVWAGALVNSVAPVSALVADDGRHVVTFDNWHSVGHGDNVIVIYGAEGRVIRSMALIDLVPQYYMDALPHSVSSLRWQKGTAFDKAGDSLILSVLVPRADRSSDDDRSIDFRIALADGSITPPDPVEWDAALEAASAVNVARESAERARLAFLLNPLSAPAGCDARAWNAYLREAHLRISTESLFDASASINMINPPGHPRHENSIGWLKEALLDDYGFRNDVAAVSPCGPGVLAEAVEVAVDGVEPGSLPNTYLYVSESKAQFERIAETLAPTGASAVWLDPSATIPQRPDRVPGSPEELAAQKDYEKRIADELSAMDAIVGDQGSGRD